MKMLVCGSYLTAVVILLGGCKLQTTDDGKALIKIGGESDTRWWGKCKKNLGKEKYIEKDDSGHVIFKSYSPISCLIISLGVYGDRQRLTMDGKQHDSISKTSDGSFWETINYMDKEWLTCKKEGRNVLKLMMDWRTAHDYEDYEYNSIDLDCKGKKNTDDLIVDVGLLSNEDKKRFAITVEEKNEDTSQSVFHAFDTDTAGIIKKYVKVLGKGGDREVIMDNTD